jgi:hypothetical protein
MYFVINDDIDETCSHGDIIPLAELRAFMDDNDLSGGLAGTLCRTLDEAETWSWVHRQVNRHGEGCTD